jgi:aldehyde dehydrogenase (NAD+)
MMQCSKSQSGFWSLEKLACPQRGEVVRQLSEALRVHKDALGKLVSYEMGKKFARRFGRSTGND